MSKQINNLLKNYFRDKKKIPLILSTYVNIQEHAVLQQKCFLFRMDNLSFKYGFGT